MQRQEDDVRARMSTASAVFHKTSTEAQAIRQEYFNFTRPRLLRVSLAHPGVMEWPEAD